MASKAMKRAARARRAKFAALAEAAGLPPLAHGGKRQPNGQPRRVPGDDPQRKTLETRCRHMNVKVAPDTLRDARGPWWGCHAGKAMAKSVTDHDQRIALWDAICHMRRVQVDFDRSIGAPDRHAQCLRLLLPLEPMEADSTTPPLDERSLQERQRDAEAALMRLEGWLGYTDSRAASQAKRAVVDDVEVKDAEGLLSALRCVSDGLNGRRLVYRGR